MPCNFASREKLKIKCNDESGHELCGNHRIDNWHPLISQIAGDCQIVSACQLEATKPRRWSRNIPRTNCRFTNHDHFPILIATLRLVLSVNSLVKPLKNSRFLRAFLAFIFLFLLRTASLNWRAYFSKNRFNYFRNNYVLLTYKFSWYYRYYVILQSY